MNSQKLFDQAVQYARQTAMLQSIQSLLDWDERCLLPPDAGEYRADQITLLAGMIHQRRTDRTYGEWLNELAASPLAEDSHSDTGTTIRWLKREYEKKTKLPQSLVEELTRTAVLSQQAWQIAKKNNEFQSFQPLLEKTVYLKQQEALAAGFSECRYDALLDDYEPLELTSRVTKVLTGLRDDLVKLLKEISASRRQPDLAVMRRSFPLDRQREFGERVAAQMGFRFGGGRLDVTAHPFCTSLGPNDCRITTKYDEHHFNAAFYSILHEAGHAMYEQGMRKEWFGLPPGDAISMAIHESQSRLWENFVGRSLPFWQHFFPNAQRAFPDAWKDASAEQVFFAVNEVRPTLIRVEADEVTYNLHILIRFELEQELLDEKLKVADLPEAWNNRYRQYLGITPSGPAEGVLQDIHWSAGLFGYFPTYSMGNLYAAQFCDRANQELGGLDELIKKGEFPRLLEWLRTHIHAKGRRFTAAELVQSVTGKPLDHTYLVRYLRKKLASVYELN